MEKIWVTSDTHFCHNRDFLYVPRGFTNPYDMNETIIHHWNQVVGPEDDVYHLGDVMLNDNYEGLKCLKQLKGKIHIIRGNHDTDVRCELYSTCWNIAEVVAATYLNYNKYHFFLSHFPCMTSNFDNDKPLKARMINLCGHSHTQDPFADWINNPIFHCEMDTNFCYPWLLDDIIEKIEKRAKTSA